jgi:signal transduction histidine kinase/CheY-like chemotaxis protein
MTSERAAQRHSILLEPEGLLVPIGSRIAYLFDGSEERTRFARFIAAGLSESDKCVIVTDEQGSHLFRKVLASLGVNASRHEEEGSLVIVTDDKTIESLDGFASPLFEDARMHYRFLRCINDTSFLARREWPRSQFLRFEVRAHGLVQQQACVMICQYDSGAGKSWSLNQIVASHQFTVVSSSVEKQPDRRPRGQVIFDSFSEQLRVLTQLQKLSLKLSAAVTLDQTLDAIMEAATTICRSSSAAISYINEAGELELVEHRGLSQEYVGRRNLTRFDPAVARIIASREPLIIENLEELKGISENYEIWKKEGIGSIVTLPLLSEGEVFGVIGAGSRAPRGYTETEINAMAILAAQASAALVNARLFEQLREANRAKDEFLSTLSHELRTPLTPILGWLHLLRPFAGEHPKLSQGLETIERNANQLSSLIKDLLDLTRIMSGKIDIAREPFDILALVEKIIEQLRPQARLRSIDVELKVGGAPIVIDVDPVRIQQIISNLTSNALKFTPDGGRITVALRRQSYGEGAGLSGILIEIKDTGIGIDPEFLPRIFDRFSQAHGGINRRFGGLGLGLAITRAIVEIHGGHIQAESEGAGKGSKFTVWLPVSVAPGSYGASSPVPSMGEAEAEHLGLRVLVIEDSPDTLVMLKLWLETFGCETAAASDAREGLRLAGERKPDLIISDIGLPEVDGYEVIRRLRKIPELAKVPAIALTGYAREEDRELAMAAGYDAHIAKPTQIGHLLQLIKKLTAK